MSNKMIENLVNSKPVAQKFRTAVTIARNKGHCCRGLTGPLGKRDGDMKRLFNKMVCSDDGAVTVDWMVLTAGIIGMCVAIIQVFDVAFDQYASNTIIAAFDVLNDYLQDVLS